MSDRSSRVSRSEMGRSVARVYDPTLQERAQHFLEGPSGLHLELVNLSFSCLIFALYIIELYHPNLAGVAVKRAIEVGLTSFFIFDLGLHLFVSLHPLDYLLSVYGLIDVVTIVPSFLMFFARSSKSSTFFVLRVLRIFRALRVLRLKRFIRFKQHGFNYELSVFLLSSVAVILCAAGLYHAMEEAWYLDHGESLFFHQALYFILVTISTVGYGDISPQTSLGQVFVMLLIVAVFTIIPQKATKLNALAKQNHAYDKDYTQKNRKSGHVIVSGQDISVDTIWDFLDEFYHASRGNIQMDVVFMCEKPPSPLILRLLSQDRYAQRTRYLRGSLSNGNDQNRARLGEASAVFFLANKLIRRESAQQDARNVLHTLAVRNFVDSYGIHIDIHTQLRSRDQELEVTAQLLGSNTTNTSDLQTMILSRSAICPGASTLILNLLHSVSVTEYARCHKNLKGWIEEYVDGLSYQAYPLIFTKRFQYEKYDDVVQNIYEHYQALVVMVRRRQKRSANSSHIDTSFRISPFQTVIREGDIGIVLAKTAAEVLHIVSSYGFWNQADTGHSISSPRSARPVRVSTESLMKRQSHPSRLYGGKSALSLLEQSRSYKTSEFDHAQDDAKSMRRFSSPQARKPVRPPLPKTGSFAVFSSPGKVNEMRSAQAAPIEDQTEPIIQAVRTKNFQELELLLWRDHLKHDARDFDSHFVVCGGRLRDSLSIVAFIRRFANEGVNLALTPSSPLPRSPKFVLMAEQYPSASDFVKVLSAKEDYGEDIGTILNNVIFITGIPSRAGDLKKAGIERAARLLLLPAPSSMSKFKLKPTNPHKSSSTVDAQNLTHENLTDFGVINSLLIAEVVREEIGMGDTGHFSPRRRHSSRLQSHHHGADGADCSLAYFRREVEQGLPIECIKVRMLERFPDLDPTMFNQIPEVISTSLQQYDSDSSLVDSVQTPEITDADHHYQAKFDDVTTIALLYHASSAKFCRPRDPAISHDEFPCVAPSFASGEVVLSSVLDRILCQAFYNPYITDVVRALACGDPDTIFMSNVSHDKRTTNSTHSRRLFQVPIDSSHIGVDFATVFRDYLEQKMLVVAMLRAPTPGLENLRPFVLTCPPPHTTVHLHDRLFVLG